MVAEYIVPSKDTIKTMQDLQNERTELMKKYLNDLDESTDMFTKSAGKLNSICMSEYILLFPAIFYILGFALIAAYILIFMNFYIE